MVSDPVSSFEADFNVSYTFEEHVSSDSHLQCSPMLSSVNIVALMMQMTDQSGFLSMKTYLFFSYPSLHAPTCMHISDLEFGC